MLKKFIHSIVRFLSRASSDPLFTALVLHCERGNGQAISGGRVANDGSVSFAVSLSFVSQTQFGCICLKKKKNLIGG